MSYRRNKTTSKPPGAVEKIESPGVGPPGLSAVRRIRAGAAEVASGRGLRPLNLKTVPCAFGSLEKQRGRRCLAEGAAASSAGHAGSYGPRAPVY